MSTPNDSTLIAKHRDRFGHDPELIARSPGRINLIGEHIDYSGGIVLPMAIDRHACVAVSRSEVPDRLRMHAADLGEDATFDLRVYAEFPPKPGGWFHYVLGPIAMVLDRLPERIGLDLTMSCDVPSGAGLSSSAAIEGATLRATDTLFGLRLAPIEIARLCQRAEHRYAGVPCGLMDQAASVLAEPGQLLALDCRDESFENIVGIPGTALIVLDSGIRHTLGDSPYRDRRSAAEQAAGALGAGLRELADRGEDPDLGALPAETRDAAAHAISEMRRVQRAISAIREHDSARLGTLLNESHASLRDTLRVSCSEIDELVELVQGTGGVHGARMTGGGFGGCVIVLVSSQHADRVTEQILARSDASHVLTHRW